MISRVIRKLIEERFGHPVRYSKDCDALASHISQMCRATVSASTLRRLLGFVEGNKQEPRVYTLDILANYVGYDSWEKLLASFNKDELAPSVVLEKLKPEQVKKKEMVIICYQPGRNITLQKATGSFLVTSSNERKILPGDEVKFSNVEVHYPLTFSEVLRKGNSMGKIQVAGVSGVTEIRKI